MAAPFDQSHAANVIAANSQAQFMASSYTMLAVGNPIPAGSQVTAGNGYDIAAGGPLYLVVPETAGPRYIGDQSGLIEWFQRLIE